MHHKNTQRRLPGQTYRGLHGINCISDIKSVGRNSIPGGRKDLHHVTNSRELAEELASVKINDEEILNSHDVVSLFTNTPIDKTLESYGITWRMIKNLKQRTLLAVDDIIELLEFVLTTTYFSFRGNIYKQKFGAAMGSRGGISTRVRESTLAETLVKFM